MLTIRSCWKLISIKPRLHVPSFFPTKDQADRQERSPALSSGAEHQNSNRDLRKEFHLEELLGTATELISDSQKALLKASFQRAGGIEAACCPSAGWYLMPSSFCSKHIVAPGIHTYIDSIIKSSSPGRDTILCVSLCSLRRSTLRPLNVPAGVMSYFSDIITSILMPVMPEPLIYSLRGASNLQAELTAHLREGDVARKETGKLLSTKKSNSCVIGVSCKVRPTNFPPRRKRLQLVTWSPGAFSFQRWRLIHTQPQLNGRYYKYEAKNINWKSKNTLYVCVFIFG